MNTVYQITTQNKHVIHPPLSKRHNDIIGVISQKLRLKYELKYDM